MRLKGYWCCLHGLTINRRNPSILTLRSSGSWCAMWVPHLTDRSCLRINQKPMICRNRRPWRWYLWRSSWPRFEAWMSTPSVPPSSSPSPIWEASPLDSSIPKCRSAARFPHSSVHLETENIKTTANARIGMITWSSMNLKSEVNESRRTWKVELINQ